ncbi:type I 3-dehydroquinate dehydratase [Caenimonas soli]|uniref:type I 3-dehydroquinate dehydratase n=1 Tax=Caenimonas soli TaxID=2735555 RepID=UPI001554B4A8|nr:type I 3-dehydroquinate dehydratase [Caenimonas soli]NPC56804.1 type I 3-dehydroquinate dehydratase [Caenimonas soli]
MQAKAIEVNGRPAGSGRFPAVCAPLIGRTSEKLLAEVAIVAAKKPDILEWRVDFFEGIGDTAQVIGLAARIKQAAPGIPLLFTRRSSREGGESIALSEPQVIALYRAVCASGQVELVDYEMGNEPAQVREVRELARDNGVKLILSFHDFQGTPSLQVLGQRFDQAQALGADVAKVAVMPHNMQDVLTLLSATLQASEKLEIPVVSMSMGGFGSVTRLCGWTFGSAMTFAVGESSSAPGQMPIEDINAGLSVLRKAFGKPPL